MISMACLIIVRISQIKYSFFLFCSFGDKYIERFQYILLIDEKTTLEDLQLTLFQAMIFRVLVIAYEVRIVVS